MINTVTIIYLWAWVVISFAFSVDIVKHLCNCWTQDSPAVVQSSVLSITINTSACQISEYITELRHISLPFEVILQNSVGADVEVLYTQACYFKDPQCKRSINFDTDLQVQERYSVKVFPSCLACSACRPRSSNLNVSALQVQHMQSTPSPPQRHQLSFSDKWLLLAFCIIVGIAAICIIAFGLCSSKCRPRPSSGVSAQQLVDDAVSSSIDSNTFPLENTNSEDAEGRSSTEPFINHIGNTSYTATPSTQIHRNPEFQGERHIFAISLPNSDSKTKEMCNTSDNENITVHYFLDAMDKLNYRQEIEAVWKKCSVIVTILCPDLCNIWNDKCQDNDQISDGLYLIKHFICSNRQAKRLLFVNIQTETLHVEVLKEKQLQIPFGDVLNISNFGEQNEQYSLFKKYLLNDI